MRKRVRHTEKESAQRFREAKTHLAAGATIPQACRKLGISEATFHRWRRKFAAPSRAPPKASTHLSVNARLKQLEKENKRLKLLVAELTLENSFLKDRRDCPNGNG